MKVIFLDFDGVLNSDRYQKVWIVNYPDVEQFVVLDDDDVAAAIAILNH